MLLTSAHEWHQHVGRLRAALMGAGVQVKTKNANRLAARLAGFPHENAVYAALPLELTHNAGLEAALIQDLAVFHQQILASEMAREVTNKAYRACVPPTLTHT